MKTTITAIALSGLLFSGLASADGQEDDLLYGDRMISASPSQVWVSGGLETQNATDLVYGDGAVNASPHSGFDQIADDRQFSTDFIYGS